MARAEALGGDRQSLYQRDFCLWLEQQAALLREGRFDELDLANLIEEIEAMARTDKKAISAGRKQRCGAYEHWRKMLQVSGKLEVALRTAVTQADIARFNQGFTQHAPV